MYLSPWKFFRNQIFLDYSGRWRNQSCQIFFQSVHSGVSGKGSKFAIFSANRRWPLQLLYYRTTVICECMSMNFQQPRFFTSLFISSYKNGLRSKIAELITTTINFSWSLVNLQIPEMELKLLLMKCKCLIRWNPTRFVGILCQLKHIQTWLVWKLEYGGSASQMQLKLGARYSSLHNICVWSYFTSPMFIRQDGWVLGSSLINGTTDQCQSRG